MTYYIVGKNAARIDDLITKIAETFDTDLQLKHIEPYMMTDNMDGKIIYISTPFAFSWDWYIGNGFALEKAGNMFCDEIMLFRGFNKYDFRINYTDFDDVVDKVTAFIMEDSNENPL